MNLKGKKIVVIGMGKTGLATVRFLGGQGASVVATDEKPSEKWGAAFEQIAGENWLTIGEYNAGILDGASMVVPSPGVPPANSVPVKVSALVASSTTPAAEAVAAGFKLTLVTRSAGIA